MGSSAIQQQALALGRMKKPLKLLTLCVIIFSFMTAPKNCMVWSNIMNSIKKKSFYFVHVSKNLKASFTIPVFNLVVKKNQCTFIKNRSLN